MSTMSSNSATSPEQPAEPAWTALPREHRPRLSWRKRDQRALGLGNRHGGTFTVHATGTS